MYKDFPWENFNYIIAFNIVHKKEFILKLSRLISSNIPKKIMQTSVSLQICIANKSQEEEMKNI